MAQTGSAIEGIRPVAPSPSILTSARPLPVPFETWRTGVSWAQFPTQQSINWPRCNVKPGGGDWPTKDDPNDVGVADTDSFAFYTPVACAPIFSADQEARIVADATDLNTAQTAWAVARAMWLGEGYSDPDTPTLRNSAVNVTDSTVDTLQQAFANLLHAYQDATGGLGGMVLHVPDELITASWNLRIVEREGNIYRGPNGSIVSPGPGYPHGVSSDGADGFGPYVNPGNHASGFKGNLATECWVYVTGPVEYAATPERVLPEAEAERRGFYRLNEFEVWAEAMAIVRFDPARVWACKCVNPAEPS